MTAKMRDEVHLPEQSSPTSEKYATFADKYGQSLDSWVGGLNGAGWNAEKEPLG